MTKCSQNAVEQGRHLSLEQLIQEAYLLAASIRECDTLRRPVPNEKLSAVAQCAFLGQAAHVVVSNQLLERA